MLQIQMLVYVHVYIQHVQERGVYIYIICRETFRFHFCVTELFLSILDGYRRPQGTAEFNVSSFVQMLLTGNVN